MSGVETTLFFNPVQSLEVYYKDRIISIHGRNSEEAVRALCNSVVLFRGGAAKGKVSEEEKVLISSRYAALAQRIESAKQTVFLSLRHFLPEPSLSKPRCVGLEAEYVRPVRASESTPSYLEYEQPVGSIEGGGRFLARIKLDGVTSDTKFAILELECRPYSLDSKEFSQQLRIIESMRRAILRAKEGSSVQSLLDNFGQESTSYKLRVERAPLLVFDTLSEGIGPYCQVTVELPLSRLGDPADKAILDLVECPYERELLQHARIAADALVKLMRPLAAKLHGDLYEMNSIKLAKLRGYWAQSIMQACQVIYYEEAKWFVGFHIRAAGPYWLSARDNALLTTFFDINSRPSEFITFEETLKQALKKGIIILAADDKSKDVCSIANISMMLMQDYRNFQTDPFRFKASVDTLRFAYGMTLVELRDVESSLNRGIIKQSNPKPYSRIKSAQALPESRPKKTLNV